MNIEKKRQSNFELLRVVAMFMIVAHHLCVHGVQQVLMPNVAYKTYFLGSTINKIFVSLLYPGGTIGVALFFMITGYFIVDKEKISVRKVCLETIFYCLLSVIVFISLQIGYKYFGIGYPFTEYSIARRAIFAILTLINPIFYTYWFVSTYVILCFLAPALNRILNEINKKGYIVLLLSTWIVLYFIQTCHGSGVANLGRACFFYILGTYFRKYKFAIKSSVLYFLIALILWAFYSFCAYYLDGIRATENILKQTAIQMAGGGINCLLTPLCAVSIFIFFLSLNFSNKFINILGSTTFGIYLIHESVLSSFIWNGIFKVSEVWVSAYFPLFAILDVTVLFSVCSLIDYIRIRYFEIPLLNKINGLDIVIKRKFLKKGNENA